MVFSVVFFILFFPLPRVSEGATLLRCYVFANFVFLFFAGFAVFWAAALEGHFHGCGGVLLELLEASRKHLEASQEPAGKSLGALGVGVGVCVGAVLLKQQRGRVH